MIERATMTADAPYDFPYEEVPEETRPEVLRRYWGIAKGLQAVDDLKPSERLQELSQKHIDGVYNLSEAGNLLRAYYDDMSEDTFEGYKESNVERMREADFVSLRITELLIRGAFLFAPEMLQRIHAYLFQDLDPQKYMPGAYKQHALQKQEFILNGDSVVYADPSLIDASLKMAFEEELTNSYGHTLDGIAIANLALFISRLWQVHPFVEGNTRTIAVFTVLYLNDLGYDLTNEPFEQHSQYFRNALVRATYRNPKVDVFSDRTYLEKFLSQAINGTDEPLQSHDHIVKCLFADSTLLRNAPYEKALRK